MIYDTFSIKLFLEFQLNAENEQQDKATAKVQIKIDDVNEFSPEFDQDSYEFNVTENIEAGGFIGKVKANDKDYSDANHLRFSIEGIINYYYYYQVLLLSSRVYYSYFW